MHDAAAPPLIDLLPEADSARRVETSVRHEQKTNIVRFSLPDSRQSERCQPGYRKRNKENYAFNPDGGQESERKEWYGKVLVGQYNEFGFEDMTRQDRCDSVAQDGSQFVIVADGVVEEAGGDQYEAGPGDARDLCV